LTERSADAVGFAEIAGMTVIQRVLHHIEEGRTDTWIMDRFGLMQREYFDIKHQATRKQVEVFRRRSTEEIYAEYVFQQAKCVRDLTDAAKEASAKKDIKALITAIKTRSDIYDKIIKTGQDFGIIERKAERREIALGVVLASLSDEDLRARISGELTGITDLMTKFGDKDLLELKPGKLHRKLPALPSGKVVDGKKSKTNRARANKVHGGRRIVKK